MILEKIQNQYSTLSENHKKIANLVLSNTDFIIDSGTTAELIAEKSKTSPATVVRFAKTIGCKGLQDLKLSLMKEISTKEINTDLIPSKKDNAAKISEKVKNVYVTSVENTFELINFDEIYKASEKIKHAKKVHLFGIGASGIIAFDLYHKFNRFDISTIYEKDAHMSIEFATHLNDQDVAIIFSYSGETKESLAFSKVIKERNVFSISITRSDESSIAQNSDISIVIPNSERLTRVGAISSKVAESLVADILFLECIKNDFDKTEETIITTRDAISKL